MIELSTLNVLTYITKGDTLVGITGTESNKEMVLYDSSLMSPTLNFKGEWATNTSYNTNDVILHEGSSYIVTSSFVSSTVFDSSNLFLLAEVGQTGPQGESAYQVAVDNGYSGTESEWLATLVGPKGDTGAQGEQGPTGPQGPQGPKGDTGADGKDGTDATVSADTVVATTANPDATLGSAIDDALSAIRKNAINIVSETTAIAMQSNNEESGIIISEGTTQVLASSADQTNATSLTLSPQRATLYSGIAATTTTAAQIPAVVVSGTGASLQSKQTLDSSTALVQVSPDGTLVLWPVNAVPTSPTDAGTSGEIRFDANYMYRCVTGGSSGAAKWVRFPVDSTWT